jgi:adenosylcobalamin-dependent ribonucleoside-triphosphate reductase
MENKFILDPQFLGKYKNLDPSFGYNGLGEFVYIRTYSRLKENGDKERWWETVKRVVEGIYQMQMDHINNNNLGWNFMQGQRSAQNMYDLIFNFKFLPPGRGLWAMGTDIINKKKLYAALNNCAFISTSDIDQTYSEPFKILMDLSMLGCGVGFDTEGFGKIIINKPENNKERVYIIPDTREGWVESIGILIDSYIKPGGIEIKFDYSKIRPAGEPLKIFGGISSGKEPLEKLHEQLKKILDEQINKQISERVIVDIMNLIGIAVVSGNIRRSAEMALGNINSDDFLNLKNLELNPERKPFYWISNNTIKANIGDNYSKIVDLIKKNGEPGICWLDNMRKYSRMNGIIDNKDFLAQGMNPCGEITATNGTLCCLSEVFINKHSSLKEFLRTLKFAYLYAKSVTLGIFHIPLMNKVQLKERRIGLSLSGIAQFLCNHTLDEFKKWMICGYDEVQKWDKIYSDWLTIPMSIKTTTIKPSGTISLLVGSTPGIHFPKSEYYIRRVRINNNDPLINKFKNSGYTIEKDFYDSSSHVIEFPVWQLQNNNIKADTKGKFRTVNDLSLWEQVSLQSLMQENWADNQISSTIEIKKGEENDIEPILNYFQYHLKSISFLPSDQKEYKQMPIEPITKEKYEELISKIKKIDYYTKIKIEDAQGDKYCTNEICIINNKH